MKESAFSKKVMKKLRAMPEVLFCMRVETGDTAPGTPDIYLICTDVKWTKNPEQHRNKLCHVWIELKQSFARLKSFGTKTIRRREDTSVSSALMMRIFPNALVR